MTLPTSFYNLISAVKELVEDDSAEFENYVPTAIYLAEQRLCRELDLDNITLFYPVSLAVGNRLVPKPTEYRLAYNAFITTSSGQEIYLKKKTDDYIKDYWPIASSVGTPKYYGEYNQLYWIVAPTPDTPLLMTVSYFGYPAPLTDTNQTNYFTTLECSNILFLATMGFMLDFSKNYQVKEAYEQEYIIARDAYNNEARRRRRDDGSSPMNPETQINNLQGKGN